MHPRLLLAIIALIAIALIPASASAQTSETDDGDLALRINGPFVLPRGETAGTVIVISDDATISGVVEDALIVVDGTATVRGEVRGSVTIISGDLILRDGALVDGDVVLLSSDLDRAPGATVTGDVEERSAWFRFSGAGLLFGFLFWLGGTIVVLLAGLLFAAVGGSQLTRAADAMPARPGQTILTALVVAIGLPIVAILAMLTVIGIPAGLALLLFLAPALAFLGYLVAGTFLGRLILNAAKRPAAAHPYAAALLGLVILQVIVLVPGLGFAVAFILGLWGTGGLVYLAWQALRGHRSQPESAAE